MAEQGGNGSSETATAVAPILGGVKAPTKARPIFADNEAAEISRIFRSQFESYLSPGETLLIDGDIDDDGVLVRAELASGARDEVGRFEVGAVLRDNAEVPLVDIRAGAVEFLMSWLAQWIRDGRFPRPHLDFKEYRWDDVTLRFRGDVSNAALVDEADRLLREAGFDPNE